MLQAVKGLLDILENEAQPCVCVLWTITPRLIIRVLKKTHIITGGEAYKYVIFDVLSTRK